MEKTENEKESQEIENSLFKKNTSLFNILKNKEEQMIEIQKKDIPSHIMDGFEGYSQCFILPEQYKKGNFQKYRYINHSSPVQYISYIALQKEKTEGYPEKNIYIFEQNREGEIIGHGEIKLVKKGKPVVGFTNTEEYFGGEKRQGKGYGKKRIQTMNKITESVRGLKLHSDTLFCDENAKKVRKKLEKEGLVKKYLEKKKERFCFI